MIGGGIVALSSFYQDTLDINDSHQRQEATRRIIAKSSTIGAMSSAGDSSGNASGIVGAAQMGFGILGGAIVVNIGGYDHFERGVLVLIALSIISIVFSTISRKLKKN